MRSKVFRLLNIQIKKRKFYISPLIIHSLRFSGPIPSSGMYSTPSHLSFYQIWYESGAITFLYLNNWILWLKSCHIFFSRAVTISRKPFTKKSSFFLSRIINTQFLVCYINSKLVLRSLPWWRILEQLNWHPNPADITKNVYLYTEEHLLNTNNPQFPENKIHNNTCSENLTTW